MKEVFKIKDLTFYDEDHAKDYDDEYEEDLDSIEYVIPIIKELQDELIYEKITCTEVNKCCNNSKDNYLVEIQGYINSEDEFITKKEFEQYKINRKDVELYIIRIFKCTECGKWIIDILEEE